MPIDVERLKTQCAYESQVPLAVLAGDMDAIRRAVEKWKGYRRKIRYLCTAILLIGIVCLFAEQVLIGLVAIAASVAGFVYAFKYARGVVTHQQRCDLVKSLASMLAHDSHPKAPASVKLVLKEQRTLLRDEPWAKRSKGKQKFFTENWLTFENRMLDGTTVSYSVTDLVRVRTYVNPRGKSKSKTRVRHLVAMRFVYPPELYGDLRKSGARLKDPFKLPPSVHVKALAVTESDLKVKARVDNTADLSKACTILGLGAYRMLNLGRRVASHQGGAQ